MLMVLGCATSSNVQAMIRGLANRRLGTPPTHPPRRAKAAVLIGGCHGS